MAEKPKKAKKKPIKSNKKPKLPFELELKKPAKAKIKPKKEPLTLRQEIQKTNKSYQKFTLCYIFLE